MDTEPKASSSFIVSSIKLFLFLVVYGYGAIQIYLGFVAINQHHGLWWAIGALIILIMGLPWPMCYFAYLGAMEIWGWHWVWAILFTSLGWVVMPFVSILPLLMIAGVWKTKPEK